ncbi:MAG: hypothetical protein PHT60_13955 [Acidiphilium sp.]|nr:hypothetical protein [Acidiphilium sp.]MDD4936869.1 hypothetical protein [Acidiphilium sp.]
MLRQYFASPFMGGNNPLRIGTIAVGSIYYIQDDGWWHDRFRGAPVCRDPWIVEAFLNGVCAAARRNPDTGRWDDVYLAGRSDLAIVRSLRTGKRQIVTVRILKLADDEGHHRIWPTYPDHPAAHLVERFLNRDHRRHLVRRAA